MENVTTQRWTTARFQTAPRVLNGVLSRVEKRTLVWLACRMPRWVNSDHLTALALVAMAGAGAAYAGARMTRAGLLVAIACLAINWFGDSLDGTLARVRDRQRPRYGFYVDHVVDCIGAVFLFGGMALSGYINTWLAVAILIVYLLLSAEAFLATYCVGTFTISTWGFGPTELRILLSIGNLAVFFNPMTNALGKTIRVFDLGGVIAVVCLVAALLTRTIAHTRVLYRAERLR